MDMGPDDEAYKDNHSPIPPGYVLRDGVLYPSAGFMGSTPPRREAEEPKVRVDVAEYLQQWFDLPSPDQQ